MSKAPVKTRKPLKKANGHARKAKPRAALDPFGFRVGSLKSKAAAMYSTSNGATLAEVKAKLKSTQFNVLTELKAKKFKVKQALIPGAGNRKVTKYMVVTK